MCEIKHDEMGPLKVVHLHSAKAGLDAIVVVDNIALGPAMGGVRVSPSVGLLEVQRLARTMTLKNSIAGLPHGGGKAGIVHDPGKGDKRQYFKVFASLIKGLSEYIPGPDMGSDEECMAWIYEETGRAVGLPERMGGLPLDKLGATGFGLAECAEVACPHAGLELAGSRVAIHGFGSVGKAAARFMLEKGAVLVAAADLGGAICHPDGLDPAELLKVKEKTGSIVGYECPGTSCMKPEDIFSVPCDILIPAATADVINRDNVYGIKARLVLQGANLPVTREAEEVLAKRGILSVPDFIANAGGVIMAAMEYAGKSRQEAFDAIREKIRSNTGLIIGKAGAENKLPWVAGAELAKSRVMEAMKNGRY
ncbi:MAG: Glu/Leu/Phe/Val dehydrogenase [Nitrospiraceae bacterium]|nr:Glu/Leu/Phe/Val dehydrogenase [Nitrospiraceae bacterium]